MSDQPRVRDVMLTRPKTHTPDTSVPELRRLFARPSMRTAVLLDGSAFVGVVDRDDLVDAADDQSARDLAHIEGVTIGPDATVAQAIAQLERSGRWRLVVIGRDGITLEGLLCLNSGRNGFCQ